jgi:TetR/AcrR family transcriptional repressor of bet genes
VLSAATASKSPSGTEAASAARPEIRTILRIDTVNLSMSILPYEWSGTQANHDQRSTDITSDSQIFLEGTMRLAHRPKSFRSRLMTLRKRCWLVNQKIFRLDTIWLSAGYREVLIWNGKGGQCMGSRIVRRKRRKQLIEATISVISRYGMEEATVSKIGNKAGMSPGIVHHYFDSKDDLLESAMREILSDMRETLIAGLRVADDSYGRIIAIVDANFSDDQLSQDIVRSWLAFWNRAPYSKAIARLQLISEKRMRSNLIHALRQLVPAATAEIAAENLVALMNGHWLRCALDPKNRSLAQARQNTLAYVDNLCANTSGHMV